MSTLTSSCYRVLTLLLVLIATDSCYGRPQLSTQGVAPAPQRRVKEEAAFFAPDSWQPVARDSGIVIDQTPSRVRIESPKRDARLSSATPAAPAVNLTSRGNAPSPLGDAIKLVASQLLQSRGSVDEADVRAPPKQETSHGGVAIPVLEDDDVTTKKTSTTLKKTTVEVEKKTTPSVPTKKVPSRTTQAPRTPVTSVPDGLTTWVYLSGSSTTTVKSSTDTPASKTTPVPTTLTTKKLPQKTGTPPTFSKKPSPLFTSSGTKPLPNRFTKKPSEEVNATATEEETKKPETVTELSFRRRPVAVEAEMPSSYKPLPTAYPVSTKSTEEVTEATTDIDTEPTSKRPKKKKKKNKNKRRRPAKKPETVTEAVESKVEEDTKVKVTKAKPKPMGTRIYNYLAREVMPSVGVGLIGLVGLAGLAGLILYPFGAGGGSLPIRRNYDESPKPNYHYYNTRVSNSQPEEEVLGKVIAGMKDTSYVTGEQYPDITSRNPNKDDKYTRFSVESSGENTRYGSAENKEGDSYLGYNVDQSGEYSKRYPQHTRVDKDEEYTRYDASGRINTHEKPIAYETDVSAVKSEPRPVYLNNDWGVVQPEATSTTLEQKPEAMMYRGEEEPIYGTQQFSGVSRLGVGQRRSPAIEHGPRRLKRDVIKKDSVVNEADNEIDLDEKIVESTTITMTKEEDKVKDVLVKFTTMLPTKLDESNIMTVKPVDKVVTEEVTYKPEVITIEPESPEDPSLVGLLRRVAQFKMRLGLSFLRNTTQAFTRYLDGMQRRVGDMLGENTRIRFNIRPQRE